jgi:hypothetical protein
MENNLTRQIVHISLMVTGLGFIAGGIISEIHGATVIGLIVAAANVQQLIMRNKKEKLEK